MMKRKLILLYSLFILGVILLPFTVNFIYTIGTIYPVICLPYSNSEMLSYTITVLSITISMAALFVALLQNDIKVRIKRNIAVFENECKEVLVIYNDNPFPITVTEVGLISGNKINKKRLKMVFNPNYSKIPKQIESYSKYEILFEAIEFSDKIKKWGIELKINKYKNKKIIFYAILANGKFLEKREKADENYLR